MANELAIRPAVPSDAPGICAAHIASIRELCAPDYKPEEIESWVLNKRPEVYPPRMATSDFWVAVAPGPSSRADGGHSAIEAVAGFIEMHTGATGPEQADPDHVRGAHDAEIYGLYIAPWAAGRGAGRMLVDKMFEIARSRGVTRAFVFGTKTARPFYERMGFRVTCTNQHTTAGGVMLDCWRMERQL